MLPIETRRGRVGGRPISRVRRSLAYYSRVSWELLSSKPPRLPFSVEGRFLRFELYVFVSYQPSWVGNLTCFAELLDHDGGMDEQNIAEFLRSQ